jgi:hypothetical protein
MEPRLDIYALGGKVAPQRPAEARGPQNQMLASPQSGTYGRRQRG